ncbi:MAG: hypothetical protein A2729_00325 [Candidatus Buchananbacteria bacterium RIFCSPHIGHO2_01_FULL_39_14]|uniref:Uncharacterized protein n=3 Tax=Parcubacteria group TaxID=1794811 RepID=A0A1F6XVX8_9BACT|nr:MAG: hypothetical protein A3H53_02225 [Candidatus Nomurabacteria bacterium RIFCSPLOWO2_02_FULL_40_10]OGY45274.1 MAG: hypothetical protein A2729_00325 [Candidatus Buchananbacteria bacterium RIFCSPHIGHO2_01_FULL_39_14]OGY53525.1 MAG: hypothetical protein A2912_06090 [Candidatus Buchananbacteria bacterium RIFCSPLOWO2_01_FULL_40_23b]
MRIEYFRLLFREVFPESETNDLSDEEFASEMLENGWRSILEADLPEENDRVDQFVRDRLRKGGGVPIPKLREIQRSLQSNEKPKEESEEKPKKEGEEKFNQSMPDIGPWPESEEDQVFRNRHSNHKWLLVATATASIIIVLSAINLGLLGILLVSNNQDSAVKTQNSLSRVDQAASVKPPPVILSWREISDQMIDGINNRLGYSKGSSGSALSGPSASSPSS